jgi:hypothetical protein
MFDVIVGNIGTVYSGTSKRMAMQEYRAYTRKSKAGLGRAGNEDVTVFFEGDILDEFISLAWRIEKLDATIAQLERHLQAARETREELIMTTRGEMSKDEIVQEIRYILGSLEDQYECSDREMCEQVVEQLSELLRAAK